MTSNKYLGKKSQKECSVTGGECSHVSCYERKLKELRQSLIEVTDELEDIQGMKESFLCSCDVCELIRKIRISAGVVEK